MLTLSTPEQEMIVEYNWPAAMDGSLDTFLAEYPALDAVLYQAVIDGELDADQARELQADFGLMVDRMQDINDQEGLAILHKLARRIRALRHVGRI